MSALTDPSGFKLSTLVETQRGLTEAEAHNFLLTGQLPDLSLPPAEPDRTPTLPTIQVIALGEAEAWLAGRFPGLTAALTSEHLRLTTALSQE